MASENDSNRALDLVERERHPHQTRFFGVIDPRDTNVESTQTVRDRTLRGTPMADAKVG